MLSLYWGKIIASSELIMLFFYINLNFVLILESIESTFWGPERIRYNSLGKDAISSHGMRMVCGICQKLMRRKLCFLGNTLSSSELPVAAVLVCGHVYHAECLENRSNVEDRSDPPCPLCMEPLPKADDSKGEEQEWVDLYICYHIAPT